jgi:protocadherin Fat 4
LDAEAAQGTFRISDNGTIYTIADLDREREPFYTFKVTVRDEKENFPGGTGHSATCMVQISISDINDYAPEIELPPQHELSVVENSPPNTAIARIAATDRDAGVNSELHYFLEDSLLMKFSIGRIDGILRSVVSLDREDVSQYDLSVKVVDNGQPRLSSKVDIKVKVEDLNDNVPKFNPKYYSTRVLENSSIGMDVIETNAFDADEGKNGQIRYAIISGNSEGDFAVGEYSGIIRVNKKLDYERKNSYDLTVQAEDQGAENSRYDTTSVSIAVSDVNDCAPEFIDSPYR